MNTLSTYKHTFSDFDSVFPLFGPLKSELEKVLKDRGLEAYRVNVVDNGWLTSKLVVEEAANGKFLKLRKLENFDESNCDLGWLNKARLSLDEAKSMMKESHVDAFTLTNFYEIYTGLQLRVGLFIRKEILNNKHEGLSYEQNVPKNFNIKTVCCKEMMKPDLKKTTPEPLQTQLPKRVLKKTQKQLTPSVPKTFPNSASESQTVQKTVLPSVQKAFSSPESQKAPVEIQKIERLIVEIPKQSESVVQEDDIEAIINEARRKIEGLKK